MKIKEFAQRTGLSIYTIRFYEKVGLLTPNRHTENGYREFTEADLEAVTEITTGQALRFTLAEIRAGAEMWRSGLLDDATKIALLTSKLKQTERQIAELQQVATYLREKIAWVERGERGESPQLALERIVRGKLSA